MTIPLDAKYPPYDKMALRTLMHYVHLFELSCLFLVKLMAASFSHIVEAGAVEDHVLQEIH